MVKLLFLCLLMPALALADATTLPIGSLNSPRQSVAALASAMEAGNANQVRQILYARTKREEKFIDAMAGLCIATKKLKDTSIETFGPSGAAELIGNTRSLLGDQQHQFQLAQEKIAGDYATLTVPDVTIPPVVLQRIDGQWRIPISELTKGLTPTEFDQRVALLKLQTAILSQTASQIAANKYHTGQEAAEQMHKRMLAAATQPTISATTPSTQSSDPGH